MNFDRLQLRHLRCLAAVGQERNLVRAASALALTQPAVSKTMAELEDIVGRQLLVRRRRGVDLTAAGEVLLRHAVATLRSLREGVSLALDEAEGQQLRVAVGALPNMAAGVLPEAIALLVGEHPQLRVRVVSGTNAQLMAQLRQGEIDLVVGRLAQPAALVDLSFQQLYSEPLLLVARPAHPLAGKPQPPVAALAAYPLVVPLQGTLVRDTADAFLYARGNALPGAVVEATDNSFILSLLARTDAIWFAPKGAADGALAQGSLVRIDVDTRATDGPVGITWRRVGEPGDGARRLAEAIERVVRRRARAA
ncbi:MAG: LysR family transcriptional regulator [Proteobacteria bacterium]|nr:LysR family transcriptional regulator [Pseudomonadota bacterium]